MKKRLTILNLFFAVQLCFGQKGCNDSIPGWGESLGVISFKTDRTWIVGNQEWSDVVMAEACQKKSFNSETKNHTIIIRNDTLGGQIWPRYYESYNADCRSNLNYGDLFSWCAVYRFRKELCPDDWRVPTRQDFIDLDIALGGTGERRFLPDYDSFIRDTYLNPDVWGGVVNTLSKHDMEFSFLESRVYYWTQSVEEVRVEFNIQPPLLFAVSFYLTGDPGFSLSSRGLFYPNRHFINPSGGRNYKHNGYQLRCVRDK